MSLLDRVFLWLGHGRYYEDPEAVSDGGLRELLIDSLGRLQVRVVGGPIVTHTTRAVAPSAGSAVGSGARKLVAAWGFNNGEAPVYVGFYDRSTVPNDEAHLPTEQILVQPREKFSFYPPSPIQFSAGLSWASSSEVGHWASPGGADIVITILSQAGT